MDGIRREYSVLPKHPQKIDEILKPLILNDETYGKLKEKMRADMNMGLSTDRNQDADTKMYITYVRCVPTGSEKGNYLALDLGGTNFRVLLIKLSPGEEVKMESKIYMVPRDVMTGTGVQLFDHIAGCIESFMIYQNLDKNVAIPLGFTFSFPCKQEGLDKARLVTWTKGFSCSGVVGEDIVELLHAALDRKSIRVKCVAVINDTVGALMSCAHEDKNCHIGLILGTGTNACYLERLTNVHQWDGDDEEPREVVINTEWGAFGNGSALDFICTEYDANVDNLSINPGRQIYEKMISGMYMGEIARQVIMKLVDAGCLFNGVASQALATSMSFRTKYISEIESDEEFDNFVRTRQVLDELHIRDYRLADCLVIQEVCQVVSTRAAYLAAAGISVLLDAVTQPEVTIAVDGSLYRYHPKFHDLITEKVAELSPNKVFKLMLSSDGSGKGAALVAAVAWTRSQAKEE
ncbi:hexokinase-like isoform X2 [Watersipora subatra]|uniref:hexokinase-like isoform X2 n=1 Tax=Watersipora subatra TaxID=2589382 RepID=UPI00355C6E13